MRVRFHSFLAFCKFIHVVDGFCLSRSRFLHHSHPWYPHFSLQVPPLTSVPMFWDPPGVNWDYLSGHGFRALVGDWWCPSITWYISEDSSWLSPRTYQGPDKFSREVASQEPIPDWLWQSYAVDGIWLLLCIQCRNCRCCESVLAVAVPCAEDTIFHLFSIPPRSSILEVTGFSCYRRELWIRIDRPLFIHDW